MTNPSARKPAPRHSHEPTSRHYHESGNLGRRVKKTYIPSFPQKRESKLVRTETYRIKRFLRFHVLDSRLRGNDGRTVSVFSDKFLKLKISSFLQKQKTKIRNLKFVIRRFISFPKFQHNRNLTVAVATEPSFPRKWESSPFSFGHFR
ncbi:Uncharacterised protein [Neisseria meningitidis]|nr:Uncharacterised protein [Neisseria meningitidis]